MHGDETSQERFFVSVMYPPFNQDFFQSRIRFCFLQSVKGCFNIEEERFWMLLEVLAVLVEFLRLRALAEIQCGFGCNLRNTNTFVVVDVGHRGFADLIRLYVEGINRLLSGDAVICFTLQRGLQKVCIPVSRPETRVIMTFVGQLHWTTFSAGNRLADQGRGLSLANKTPADPLS